MVAALVIGVLGPACYGFVPRGSEAVSFGFPEDGLLQSGGQMAPRGDGYVLARPTDATRAGMPSLVRALLRAAQQVARAYPGGYPLRIGDLSGPGGGAHSRHNSHRTGRDVDLIFYLLDAQGAPRAGTGTVRFDDTGIARTPGATSELVRFDDARNWALVRALLTDRDVDVLWIFCSEGVKARLLRYAAAVERDADLLFRATWVLHQPSNGRAHDDHFHVRIACTAEDRSQGCADHPPVWPWIRARVEKPAPDPPPSLDDEALVLAIAADLALDSYEGAASSTGAL